MFNLNHEKKIDSSDNVLNFSEIKYINKEEDNMTNAINLSYDTFSLSKKFYQKDLDKNIQDLPNSTLLEIELTPNSKKYIKSILSPFAVFSFILQESSIAFGKIVAASISLLVFSIINSISSASITSNEISLPITSICLFGSILGARDLVKSIKKIILSVPNGIRICYKNITCEDCSVLDFICGIDKHNQNLIKKISKQFF